MADLAVWAFDQTVTYVGDHGPSVGKRIVLLAGDEEYRSEEGLPQLARILAKRHGFTCTVVFSMNANGEIDPNEHHHQPGLEALDHADVCVMLLRFREWPDGEMRHFVDFVKAGKPIVALRTSTHAFDYPATSTSPYRDFGWRFDGGFGRKTLGETWISHWGVHAKEATLGVFEPSRRGHPILRGVDRLFGTTDVYEAAPPPDADVLVRGRVLSGLHPNDPPAVYRKKSQAGVEQGVNDPMQPIVWTRERPGRVVTTTMGAATDFLDEGVRRLVVNAVFWGLRMEPPARANVDLVGDYRPSPFGFNGFRKGVRIDDPSLRP